MTRNSKTYVPKAYGLHPRSLFDRQLATMICYAHPPSVAWYVLNSVASLIHGIFIQYPLNCFCKIWQLLSAASVRRSVPFSHVPTHSWPKWEQNHRSHPPTSLIEERPETSEKFQLRDNLWLLRRSARRPRPTTDAILRSDAQNNKFDEDKVRTMMRRVFA